MSFVAVSDVLFTSALTLDTPKSICLSVSVSHVHTVFHVSFTK